jgi:hypothetical protein
LSSCWFSAIKSRFSAVIGESALTVVAPPR